MFHVVTSWGPGGYELYGKRFLETFVEFWPESIPLTVYYHDTELPEDALRFSFRATFVKLNDVDPEFNTFRERAEKINGVDAKTGRYDYRLDAYKFSPKVFAVSHLAGQLKEGQLIWLDADTFSHDKVDEDFLKSIQPADADMVCLRRTGIYYSETSYVSYTLNTPTIQFLLDMRDLYVDGEIFHWREYHDGFIFERLMYIHILHGLKVYSLTPPDYAGLEAFENSLLATKMHHLKGNLKDAKSVEPAEPVLITRYDQLNELVKYYAQGNNYFAILETGTWAGKRAIEMSNAAFAAGAQHVYYEGYDLFEGANDSTDKAEFNTKAHHTREDIVKLLDDYADQVRRNGRKFTFNIVQGDTKKRLKKVSGFNFAFLDGGHSHETASHDFRVALAGDTPVIVLDDYITTDPAGGDQPDEHKGTNLVFDSASMDANNLQARVYDSIDPVMGGGVTHLAVLAKKSAKKLPTLPCPKGNSGWRPMIVEPRDCVEDASLVHNLEENLKLIKEWVKPCKAHDGVLFIASGGPELGSQTEEIKAEKGFIGLTYNRPVKIMAVKHAMPYLREAGIVPWGLIVLDPREIGENSTHGVKRQDLFDMVPKETICFVASMTNPEVTKYLLETGHRVVGWHAYTQGLANYKKWPQDAELITGGTCSAWRALGLGRTLGFQEFHAYGVDLCVDEKLADKTAKDEAGRPKYLTVSPNAGKDKFITTGELIAAAQDIQQLVGFAKQAGFEFYVHGERFGGTVYKEAVKNLRMNRENFWENYQ